MFSIFDSIGNGNDNVGYSLDDGTGYRLLRKHESQSHRPLVTRELISGWGSHTQAQAETSIYDEIGQF
jgi:hypothetical protein